MLWTSYFKHNCTSVKVHRNNEHSIGLWWRKWIQNRPCYGIKMKQCLGKFHYYSTNKTKEMGEERRKVKYICVLQGRRSGRKFRVRVLASAPPLDLGIVEPLHGHLQTNMWLAPSTRSRDWRDLGFTQLSHVPQNLPTPSVGRLPFLLPQALQASSLKQEELPSLPSPFTSLLHTPSTDPCLSKSFAKCLLPIDWD